MLKGSLSIDLAKIRLVITTLKFYNDNAHGFPMITFQIIAIARQPFPFYKLVQGSFNLL
jgi:hypothetical protein